MTDFNTISLPEVCVPRTPSPFAVFAAIRATCLENKQRQAALMQFQSAATWKEIEEGYSSDGSPEDPNAKKLALPKIVGIGLHGVFEIIRESQVEFPSICKRALDSLFNILQGLQPEELMNEPVSVMDPMFQTLLDLADSSNVPSGSKDDGLHIRALACACLLSIAVSLGDTGKLLRASSAMLMSHKGSESIVMPNILVSLQRSVVSVMLAKIETPDHMTQGVLKSSCLDNFEIDFKDSRGVTVHSLASDGGFIYMQTNQGLYKIGSGYAGTIKGNIYRHKADFEQAPGWLGCVKESIYFKQKDQTNSKMEVCLVDRETLEVKDVLVMKDHQSLTSSPYLMFSDGSSLGVVTVTNNDNFAMKFLNIGSNFLTCDQEMPLKLARKCVDLFGTSILKEGEKQHSIDFGCEEEAVDVKVGKDFAFMLSQQGKLFFSGEKLKNNFYTS